MCTPPLLSAMAELNRAPAEHACAHPLLVCAVVEELHASGASGGLLEAAQQQVGTAMLD